MDLSVLHAVKSPDRDYTMKDKLNGITSPLGCLFLEWSGWYNQNLSQRLLGHYRLFQLFKAKNKANTQLSLPLAYITHYRTLHAIKYALSCITAVLYCIFTVGGRYYPLQVEGLNKQLISHNTILLEFLTNTEVDFEKALFDAIDQINGSFKEDHPNTIVVQNRLDYKVYNTTCHYLSEYNTTVHSNTTIGIRGKEKDVFSKKQILIWFDLHADLGKSERIDFTKPNKFEDIAAMLQAINGKSKESWVEELNKYKVKGLYYYSDQGELRQLIITITNISDIVRKAGRSELAKAADKKIKKLERLKNINYQ